MNLTEATAQFLTQLRADGRSQHTIRQYQRHLRGLGLWWSTAGGGPVETVGDEDVARFLASDAALLRPDGEPKCAGSMNALRSSVRGFFGYLHRAGRIPVDPARVVRMARTGESIPHSLGPGEVERLLGILAAGDSRAARRDHALFAFLLGTGARIGSALALDVEDLDLVAGEARLREVKGGGALTVFLSADVVAALARFLEDRTRGPVFCGHAGERLSARHAQRRFELWRERAGLPSRYSPHSLRHTFAMGLYERTGDVLLVKEALGHKAISSTMVYARAGSARVRAAVTATATRQAPVLTSA